MSQARLGRSPRHAWETGHQNTIWTVAKVGPILRTAMHMLLVVSETCSRSKTHFTLQPILALHLLNSCTLHLLHLPCTSLRDPAACRSLQVLGCEGTAIRTGTTGAACRVFELATGLSFAVFHQPHDDELNLPTFQGRRQQLRAATN